jgi:hypothetical protein
MGRRSEQGVVVPIGLEPTSTKTLNKPAFLWF